ncbi:Ribosome maturation factor RimP [Corynebacterium kalinowskii]|uniref:Ribosome maturation factor RimP n=1 Tax=Corynebacterium kalinowskii TaxID=2675216 RepID=A0A6B8VRL2_9CORY|nr:ribosome maturation factor RimP [Corynebacterium kalinowskii]QGU02257.1 Ribosome maturation factor RimP [Corynebacterium kalinowskii]
MAFPTADKITELITPTLSSYQLDLEELKITKAGAKSVVSIAVDRDQRPDLDLLEVVSNELSTQLDAAEERGDVSFGPGYSLELSTPGVDTPLTAPRHWRRNQGRKVAITREGQREFARIGALNDAADTVILVTRTGKKLEVTELELAKEHHAVVEIEFSKVPADESELAAKTFDEAIAWREENK